MLSILSCVIDYFCFSSYSTVETNIDEQQREAEFYRSRGIDFSQSGSHLLNIGTPLKYTQKKVIRDVAENDIPDEAVKKISNINHAHRYYRLLIFWNWYYVYIGDR